MSSCGLDFGTSNTTLGTIIGGAPVLCALEPGHSTIPSAIFYEVAGAVLIGRRAMDAYVEGVPGRLLRSLKSVLGTSLIDETTMVGRQRTAFRAIIAYYLGAVKRRAEQTSERPLRQLVHGRPVHFVDNDPAADRKAEETLREIARGIGFDDVTFQFEPIAAALDYEREVRREEIALIADIGGGTSDFSIVRLSPERHLKADRKADILANDGVRIGGTDFDRQLSLGTVMPLFGFRSPMKRAGLDVPSGYFHDLATWANINRMYDQKVLTELRQVRFEAKQPELLDRLVRVIDEQRGHTLAMEVEAAKIALADAKTAAIPLEWIEPGLNVSIARPDLVGHTRQLAKRIGARIELCLAQAQLAADGVDAVFLTGGSVRLAHVRKAITAALPAARIVDGDSFGAVGKGLTIEASRRYGPG
ncbi:MULTISPECIES: Hsp70 family protein [Rhodopseudomonas]|uniref:Heat-shock protein n=1 Tax=Rhodopseudomonas palustris TaxID=1076 RepID=A0A0D7EF70_RHOPL|nr:MULTISPECIES: Hsp70 family protein [Rhodopseudomonas]KIZ39464.1 heat-shock protein [Rhodopseudomonas palustris]MDF3814066.1 Hsp70 family protein [Rhodopseudomonas sp. BAL398]WOK19697.1 Hsp70 family protein [Rhodopseudomonas sp. BAL398]